MVILIFINIRGKKINNKIKATKVKQHWRSSQEIKLKKKDCDRLQGHNDRGSHVGSKCWSSRTNKLIRWALSISISIFNNIVVYQHHNKFLPAQYLCEEEEEQTDGQDRTGASISEQVVIYLRRKHLTFIIEKTLRQKNEKLLATK